LFQERGLVCKESLGRNSLEEVLVSGKRIVQWGLAKILLGKKVISLNQFVRASGPPRGVCWMVMMMRMMRFGT
jgi:hypothetical protein